MKIIENITLYKCNFCSKELKRKYAMENHELKCNRNPENKRPCLDGCMYLEERDIEFDTGATEYFSGEPILRKSKTFYCNRFDKFMPHPKTQWLTSDSDLRYVYFNDEEVAQEDMPKECKDWNFELLNI